MTTTDTLATEIIPTALGAFTAAHPGIQLELTTMPSLANLTKRDADVAVRATSTPPPHLVGRRVATIAFALYASPAYLDRVPARRALEHHAWIAPDDSLASTTIARWMARTLDVTPVLRTDSFTSLAHAATAGIGVTALPCYLGDRSPGLRRVRGTIAEMATDLWVLTHEDLRNTARVRALTEHLATTLAARRAVLEGRAPST